MALLVLVALMGAAATTTTMTLSRQSLSRAAKEAEGAFVLAEAGLDLALYELTSGEDTGDDGIGAAAGGLGEGAFTVALDPAYVGPGRYTVRSEGQVGRFRKGVEAIVEKEAGSIGVTGLDGVTIKGSKIDSYDSSLGTYASQKSGSHAGSDARLSSNADILIERGCTVYGDATPGPTGAVLGDTSGVSGSTAPAAGARVVDPLAYSPPIPSSGPVTSDVTFSGGAHRIDSLVMGSGNVTISGDVDLYIDGTFKINSTAKIVLEVDATVRIFHGGDDFALAGQGFLNLKGDPHALMIQTATTSLVSIGGQAGFNGALIAPEAPVRLHGQAGFYGGLVAKTLDMQNTEVHHDVSLGFPEGPGLVVHLVRPFDP